MVSAGLAFDPAAFATYVETKTPDYLTAEGWVRSHATALTAGAIAALNARISTTKLPVERLGERRAELGPIAAELELSIPLNDLDDWAGLHRQLNAVAR